MTDKKAHQKVETIRNLGTKLEEKIKEENLTSEMKELIKDSMEFGYATGICEKDFDYKDDAYSATKCIKRYENIKKLLEEK